MNDKSDLESHCEMARMKRGKDRLRLTPKMGEGEFEVIQDEDEELHA